MTFPWPKSVVTDFQHPGLRVTFISNAAGETASDRTVRFEDTRSGGFSARLDSGDVGLRFWRHDPSGQPIEVGLDGLGRCSD